MKRHETNLDEMLDRHLGLFKSSKQSDAARENALSRLQSQAADAGAPESLRDATRTLPRWPYLLAVAAVLVLGVLSIIRSGEAHAVVQSADGSLSRISGNTVQVLRFGDRVEPGQTLRANSVSATIALADGTRVEMRGQSEFRIERVADGLRIHLTKGDLRIKAAKQLAGHHVYVQTKEMTVSVVGTEFLVNAEETGSRVAVIEGEVRVQLGAATKNLRPGEQLSTNPKMAPLSVKEEAGWAGTVEIPATGAQQAPTPAAPPKKMEFEVVSIRPSTAREPYWMGCRGIDGIVPDRRPSDITIGLGRCEGITSFNQLAGVIYPHHPLRRAGEGIGQGWCCFEFRALAQDPSRTTKEQLRQMLEDYVVANFKLKVHTEIRERLGYSLTVAKDGAKDGLKIKPTQRAEDARYNMEARETLRVFNAKVSLDEFVGVLSQLTGNGPVENKTGLQGIYEIHLTLNRIERPDPAGGGGARGALDNQLRPPTEYDPPLAKALEDQLGLKLEYGKMVPLEYFFVDSWEKPPEN
jgi:uncharacterized protein (TIGR03435 family)